MSTEDNKALINRMTEEFWNTGDMGKIDQFFAASYVQHDPTGPTRIETTVGVLHSRSWIGHVDVL